jgi:Xaa-Pro aminopeptidase
MSASVDLAALPAMEVAGRLDRIRGSLAAEGCDALLVSHLVNIRWLCGFTGSNGLLVVGEDATLVTDGRYGEQARAEAEAAEVDLRVEVATTDVVERARQVKDAGEVARLEAAAGICDRALAEVLPLLLERPTESGFALALDSAMRRLGAEQPSFATIVASGPNAARPHHRPGPRRIEAGDLVVIDVGARLDGYGSDMTRTVVVGRDPDDDQSRWWEAVREAQAAGVAAVVPGAEVRAVDAACRQVLERHGLGGAFVHGTGHGIGLEIHEDPFVNGRSVGILRPGLVITVEPGVYLPGLGGVRIEDSLVVTSDGCRPITRSPKDPVVA